MTSTIRSLVGAPVSSLAIVVTLGLAIGAVSTMFSVVRGVLLRPLPFEEPERILMLWQQAPGVGVEEDWFSPAQYFDLAEQVPSFESVALFGGRNITLTDGEAPPLRLGALQVSSSFFGLLGLTPEAGRVFDTTDDQNGTPLRVLLTQRALRSRFGGDRSMIGNTITIDGVEREVVGILPPVEFDADLFPTLSTIPVFEFLISMPMEDPQKTTRGSENYNVLARIAPGIDLEQIESELLAVAEEFAKDPGALSAGLEAGSEFRISFRRILDQAVGHVETPLWVLLAAAGLLLLIACASVANLLLARAVARSHEISLRCALGASRSRIIGLALAESLTLATLAGAFGLSITLLTLRALQSLAPRELPRLADVRLDLPVLLFVMALCLLSSVLCGVAPALRHSLHSSPALALRRAAAGVRARSAWQGSAAVLLVAQVALSMMLTVGAGLLVRTLSALHRIDPGFSTEGTLSFRISLAGDRYRERGQRVLFYQDLWPLLEALAGVERAGGTSLLPLTRGYAWTDFLVEGFNATGDENRVVADVLTVTPGYFEALGVRLLAGRTFGAQELLGASEDANSTEPVVVVNRYFAEQFWAPEEAIGKWVQTDFSEQSRIVGVVETVKHYGADAEPRLAVFFPHSVFGSSTLYGVIRTSIDPLSLAPQVSSTVRSIDPALPVYDIRAMNDRFNDSLAQREAVMMAMLLFSFAAVALATVGLYGVFSSSVADHQRELAIRAALGARKKNLYALVLRGAGIVTIIGLVLGSLGALAGARALGSLVFGVPMADPLTFVAALALIATFSMIASWLPASRAARVDPTRVLSAE